MANGGCLGGGNRVRLASWRDTAWRVVGGIADEFGALDLAGNGRLRHSCA